MINIEKEAAIIAHNMNRDFDFVLKRRIIAAIIDARADLLRKSLTSNKNVPIECVQTFSVPIEKAESFSLYYLDNYKVSARTVVTIPKPLRLDMPEPFISVTSMDGSINFAYEDFATVRFNSHGGMFVSKTGRYIYDAERIACYHNEAALLSASMITIRGIMEDPLTVRDYANRFVYSEENFPLPLDMMAAIRKLIESEIIVLPTDKDIEIDGR